MSAKRYLLLPIILAGCVSVLPEPVVPDGLYRLTSATNQIAASEPVSLPASLAVFEPSGSDLLLGRSLVFEEADGALKLLSSAEWSEAASRQFQSAMIDRLSSPGNVDSPAVFSDRFGAVAKYELQWEIRDLVIRDDEAVVSLRGLISQFRSGEVRSFEVTVRESYIGSPGVEGVKALIKGAREAVDGIAVQLPDLMNSMQDQPER